VETIEYVVTREVGESIDIGPVSIKLLDATFRRVRLGITSTEHVTITRAELKGNSDDGPSGANFGPD
jgi:carbon storage regulator CsrA